VGVAGTIIGVLIGALLPFLLPLITKKRDEEKRRRSVIMRLRAALRAAFPALQIAYDMKMIERTTFAAPLEYYISVARDPEVVTALDNEKQALWVAGAMSMFEITLGHFTKAVTQNVENDPFHRQVIPGTTVTKVLLPALSAAASTLWAFDDRTFVEKNASATVKAAISEMTRNNQAARAEGTSATT